MMHYNKIIVSVFEWMTGETKESCVSRTETDALLVGPGDQVMDVSVSIADLGRLENSPTHIRFKYNMNSSFSWCEVWSQESSEPLISTREAIGSSEHPSPIAGSRPHTSWPRNSKWPRNENNFSSIDKVSSLYFLKSISFSDVIDPRA